MMESVGVERTCGSRRFSGQHCCRLCLPGRARLPKWGPKLCPAYTCLSRRWQGAQAPPPQARRHWMWTAAWTRPCWTAPCSPSRDSVARCGLPGACPGGAAAWALWDQALYLSQQAFAGQMKQDLFLEDSKRWYRRPSMSWASRVLVRDVGVVCPCPCRGRHMSSSTCCVGHLSSSMCPVAYMFSSVCHVGHMYSSVCYTPVLGAFA